MHEGGPLRASEQPSGPVCVETDNRSTLLGRTVWSLRLVQKAGMVQPCVTHLSLGQAQQSRGSGGLPEALGQRSPPAPVSSLSGCKSVPALPLSTPASRREEAGVAAGYSWSSELAPFPPADSSVVVTAETCPERDGMCKPTHTLRPKDGR